MTISETINRLIADANIVHQVFHGLSTDTVLTDGGLLRTLAGVLNSLAAYNPRGSWATGTDYALKDVVTVAGVAYVCVSTHRSDAWSIDLSAGKWAIFQGLTSDQLAAQDGAALVGQGQGGRTVADRLADSINVVDFGAIGDGSHDDRAAIAAAVSAASGGKFVLIPRGASGRYRIASNLTIPEGLYIVYEGGASIAPDAGVTLVDNGVSVRTGAEDYGGLLQVRAGLITGSPSSHSFPLISYSVRDQLDSRGQVTPWVGGVELTNEFGGGNAAGARAGIISNLYQNGIVAPDSQYRGHTAVVGCVKVFDNGGSQSSPGGDYFGLNPYVEIWPGVYAGNVSGMEVNVGGQSGGHIRYRSGIQICGIGAVRGSEYDAALSVSGGSPLGWKHGILFGAQNGIWPFANDSTVMAVVDGAPFNVGIDFSGGYCISGLLFKGDAVEIYEDHIDIGPKTSDNLSRNAYLDFYGSKIADASNSVRMIATGGDSSANSGNFTVQASNLFLPQICPDGDNTRLCGIPTSRWSAVCAATGSIITSDETLKQDIGGIPDAWLDAWEAVEYQRFRFKDAVRLKGDAARWHCGVIAQRVRAAFETKGLDAFSLGLLCWDEWAAQEAETATIGGQIVEIRPTREAGSRYSIRYEEALCLEAALMRRTTERLEARMAALESRVA